MVVTELERITADFKGAAGAVWRRPGRDEWQTLREALDNPDGDRLYAAQLKEARCRLAEREAPEREARRPVCTACGNRFSDDRWQQVRPSGWPGKRDHLCGPCEQDDLARIEAERLTRRQAEEATARAAAEAGVRKSRGLFGRRR
ncbi:hypothetical protein [Streptomyces sp. NPDC020965]|uniref:hypothetical protein n=1 Tax=Streptomyces sp. NPDC020965 TaxID=3365105 RepID=UPI0037BAD160